MDRRGRAATMDALKRYEALGSDLTRPMEIDFVVVLPNEAAAHAVADEARSMGFAIVVEEDQASGEWACYCTKTIVPSPETVVGIEEALDAIGRSHGGYADGFGSFGNADKHVSKS